jgi:ribosome biogenesis GTPase
MASFFVCSVQEHLLWRKTTVPSRSEKQWRHHEENKAMRKVRKQIKRNRKTKKARRKDWIPKGLSSGMPDSLDDMEALYDLDVPQEERVMPRGERERRQVALTEALSRLKEQEEEQAQTGSQEASGASGSRAGMVIEVSSGLCRVQLDGHTLMCAMRGSLSAQDTGYTNVVAVGDQVIVSRNGAEQGIIETVLPRRSALARPDPFYNHLQQVIVANADQLLIVAAWRDPSFWPELVDRYLIAAERNNLEPIVCVNKIDLADDIADCHAALKPYLDLEYRIIFSSALNGQGIDHLRETLDEQTTVLAGLSGVGKSTLLNAVQPGLQLRTGVVSEYSHAGRHTTTQVNLLKLESGGYVVDTPGIREFGLTGLHRAELIRYYPEIAAVEGRCRFKDCSHTHEPACAVKAAVQAGRLSKTRYESYAHILRTLPKSRAQEIEQVQERARR